MVRGNPDFRLVHLGLIRATSVPRMRRDLTHPEVIPTAPALSPSGAVVRAPHGRMGAHENIISL